MTCHMCRIHAVALCLKSRVVLCVQDSHPCPAPCIVYVYLCMAHRPQACPELLRSLFPPPFPNFAAHRNHNLPHVPRIMRILNGYLAGWGAALAEPAYLAMKDWSVLGGCA